MLEYNKNFIPLAKNLRKDMTPQERKLWYTFLKTYPVRFQRQKTIGNYIADFYCAKAKLIIEIDGGGHYEEEQIQKDKTRTDFFNSININVIRFTNNEIDNNFYSVCSFIDETVASAPSDEGAVTK